MATRMQKRIVCKYCGYHFDAKKKRCPYCGTYAYPEDGSDKDVVFVTERVHRTGGTKVLKWFVVLVLLAGIVFGSVVVGKKVYNDYLKDELFPEEVIGTITITAEGEIVERLSPSTSSESAGVALNGEVHNVYEITEAEDYTWYRIEEDVWVPDDGTWMTYTPAGEMEDE